MGRTSALLIAGSLLLRSVECFHLGLRPLPTLRNSAPLYSDAFLSNSESINTVTVTETTDGLQMPSVPEPTTEIVAVTDPSSVEISLEQLLEDTKTAVEVPTVSSDVAAVTGTEIPPPAVVFKDLRLASLGPGYPDDTAYMMCSGCKSAYLMTEAGLGKRSLRVRCYVCEKEWFQTTERLLKTDNQHHLQNMTEDKIDEVRRLNQAMNWQSRQSGRKDKVGVFVGNLPYTFDEKEIADLFGDYGLTGVSLVRDAEGQSKGFAFLEVSNQEDANTMINEMHHFFTDASRRLTVRLTEVQTGGRGAGRGDSAGRGEGRGRGDGGGRSDGAGRGDFGGRGGGGGGYEDRGGRGGGGGYEGGGGRSFAPRGGGGGGRSAGRGGGGRSSGGRGRSSY